MARVNLIVLAGALLVSACGGSSPSAPTVQPAANVPTTPAAPTTPTVSLSTLSAESRDYVRQLSNFWQGNVTRWPGTVRVYAEPAFSEADVRAAVSFWEQGTEGKISFQLVSARAEAQTVIQMKEQLSKPEACGEATMSNSNGMLIAGQASFIFGLKPDCRPHRYHLYIAHEIGHTLGLVVHSAHRDIMDPSASILIYSPVLQETINWWYSAPPGAKIVE